MLTVAAWGGIQLSYSSKEREKPHPDFSSQAAAGVVLPRGWQDSALLSQQDTLSDGKQKGTKQEC